MKKLLKPSLYLIRPIKLLWMLIKGELIKGWCGKLRSEFYYKELEIMKKDWFLVKNLYPKILYKLKLTQWVNNFFRRLKKKRNILKDWIKLIKNKCSRIRSVSNFSDFNYLIYRHLILLINSLKLLKILSKLILFIFYIYN